ncbi:lipid-A-disaccharide synthase [Larkinella terrae]|uniref:Lipid-A-disaccharide synthase n=1 Tax=Larkinella terrae TaxID=2025311 RepID=A0A7K0ER35_9BACT|nr:lipid-A-disaccharide synthase [Larkinella terrae]MRS63986.1 lipid-A-disaccharide synthase [Larkinella terrae]
MNYYLIAGERSGDLHGGNLIKAIRQHDPKARFRAWGGEQMEEAGAVLVRHYRSMAFMGFLEVVQNLGTIRKNLRDCQEDLLKTRPDVLILIDYAGFNLRMARFANKHGIRVFYYISPKVWAWNQKRALKIKAVVDQLFVIFPFEVDFFKKYDYRVDFVGNPLMDAIGGFQPDPDFRKKNALSDKPVIALLPGSRHQEVSMMLPMMMAVIPHFPNHQFVVSGVSNLPQALYQEMMQRFPTTPIVVDDAYNLLSIADAALVTSGTATLETALLNVPEVVCYKMSWVSYQVASRLVAVPFISLVNLILEREAVKELKQYQLTIENLVEELTRILPGGSEYERQLADYEELRKKVGGPGASDRAGELMVKYLRTKGIN